MSRQDPEAERNITAFFDTRAAAEQVIAELTETGLPRDRILLRAGAARKACVVDDGKGLLHEVIELVLPSDTPDGAVEALRREGFVLTVRPDAGAHDTMVDMLERGGGLGVDSHEDIWPDWKSDPAEAQPDILITLDESADHPDRLDDSPPVADEAERPAGPAVEARSPEAEARS